MVEKFYVTTPLYYVNARPHIGHAYTTFLADVLARYHRLAGHETFFLTGTDEHGQKMAQVASQEGLQPQQLVDRNVRPFQDLWDKLGFTHDDFLRTTEDRHKKVVQGILQVLYERGDIYRSEYDGFYCVNREMYFTEKEISDGRCPECNCQEGVTRVAESNYFFRMSRYRDWLVDYIRSHPDFIQPETRRNETLAFLEGELRDLCISRPKSRLQWGIELPFDKDYVTYVWVDALANYVSALGYLTDDDSAFQKWWPASCHLIGKDILITHTVYWTTMLRALGLSMPDSFFVHGWWLSQDRKMSKSLGNIVDPLDLVEKYDTDAFRYYLAAEMVPGRDTLFSEESFSRRYNTDLANDLGNTLSRIVKLLWKHCEGRIPQPGEPGPQEEALRAIVLSAGEELMSNVERVRVDLVIKSVLTGLREVNRYLAERRPWSLIENGAVTEFRTCLYTALEAMRILAGLLHPIMPARMSDLREMIGLGREPETLRGLLVWGGLKAGTQLASLRPLFPRIEAAPQLPVGNQAAEASVAENLIGLDDLQKVKLVVARIVGAEPLAGFSKLLRLEADVAGKRRQIVSGLAGHYLPDELIGRLIVVVENLKPRMIGGVKSEGMLLAAVHGNAISPLTLMNDIPTGSGVM